MRAMVTAPHHLAGGNALEAMIAAAAAIAVVYPHMNGLGGDNFWLIKIPGEQTPVAIDACGAAARDASIESYHERGLDVIPTRGPLAALTVAGAVSGWQAALNLSHKIGGSMQLSRLLEDATWYARNGIAVTASQAHNSQEKFHELAPIAGFAPIYLPNAAAPVAGSVLKNTALADTLDRLATHGLDDFYRGDIARANAADLSVAGSPLCLEDLQQHQALLVNPLQAHLNGVRLYNLPAPTQGLASLLILAQYQRMLAGHADGFDHLHRLVECTKSAFIVRDAEITDPRFMRSDPTRWLQVEGIAALAAQINPRQARTWPAQASTGDTVWLGAVDRAGCAVSMIQSLYWEFGSGLTLPSSGIVWQNRGVSFSLQHDARQALTPGRRPFHTIQPAMALFDDGRVMPYGCMGGDGQPQSQAAVFSRYAWHGMGLQQAVTAPRWLLGRTWGEQSTNLKIESRIAPEVVAALRGAGHDVQVTGPYEEMMGHAGAIVRHPNGMLEGAADPRGDGAVACW
jgi:gamma-glutamyltranspeptidase